MPDEVEVVATTLELDAAEALDETARGAFTLACLFGIVTLTVWLTVYFGVFVPRG